MLPQSPPWFVPLGAALGMIGLEVGVHADFVWQAGRSGRKRRGRIGKILFPVFGGEMAAAKIQTVKGLRVEIFSRPLRKNTTRPLTVWIVGTDVKR